MAKAELATLQRELDQTKGRLGQSLKRNIVLQKHNHELAEEHKAGEAWEKEIKNAAADVRQIITDFKNGHRPTVTATVAAKAQESAMRGDERHRQASVPVAVESRSSSNAEDAAPQERQKCPYCTFSTLLPIVYSKHVESHEKQKKLSFGSNAHFSPSKVMATTGRDRSPSLSSNTFKAASSLTGSHPKSATSARTKFQCDNCCKPFTFKSVLESHRRACGMAKKTLEKIVAKSKPLNLAKLATRHSGATKSRRETVQFEYEGCDFATKYPFNMGVHVSVVHEKKRQFVCDWNGCSKTFKYKVDLTIHVCRDHTGERPFECTTCERKFFSSNERSQHYRTTECDRT